MDTLYNIDDLTAEKRSIILAPHDAIRVDAIAGSGKSTLLAHLAIHHCRKGVSPDKIGLLTVSRTAANHLSDLMEIQERHHGIRLPRATTIHALSLRLLKDARQAGFDLAENGRILGGGDERVQDALRRAMEQAATLWPDPADFPPLHPSPDNLNALFLAIGKVKGERRFDLRALLQEDQVDLEVLAARAQQPELVMACLIAFERIREREGFVTFPDLPLNVCQIYHAMPDARRYMAKFEVVGIDESNDLNAALLTAAIASKQKAGRVVLVGDRHQCVQANSGANSQVMLADLPRLLPSVRPMPIAGTHRFGSRLTRCLDALVAMPGVETARFVAESKRKTTMALQAIDGPADVVQLLTTQRAKHPEWSTALLYRQRSEALATEFALAAAGLRYTMIGHMPVAYDATVMALLGLLLAPAGLLDKLDARTRAELIVAAAKLCFPEWDADSQRQSKDMLIELTPFAGLGAEFGRLTLQNAARNSPEGPVYTERLAQVEAHWLRIAGQPPTHAADALEDVIMQLDIQRRIASDNLDREAQADMLAIVDALVAHTRQHGTTLAALGQLYVGARASTRVGTTATDIPGSLCLSTFLRVKGKEFDWVVLGDVSANRTPLPLDTRNALISVTEHAAVERNLFYVAVTRTRNALTMLHRREQPPSPFVEMMRSKTARAANAAPSPTEPTQDGNSTAAPQSETTEQAPPPPIRKAKLSNSPGRAAFAALVKDLQARER